MGNDRQDVEETRVPEQIDVEMLSLETAFRMVGWSDGNVKVSPLTGLLDFFLAIFDSVMIVF